MSKPLFFTGRKEISRSDVTIRLFERPGQVTRFQANIDLSKYVLPAEAIVVVEAYHTTYFERFPPDTVANYRARTQEMARLEPGDQPNFRVKVIAPDGGVKGRLLAAVDEVRPTTGDDDENVGSLLPIVPKTRSIMGDEFWRVNFSSGEEKVPELWINRDVPGLLSGLRRQEPQVTALIMPEILRQVLRGLVEDETDWTDEGRLGQWLSLAQRLYDQFEGWDEGDPDGSRQKRREWVDEVVKRFSGADHFFDRYCEQYVRLVAEEVNND